MTEPADFLRVVDAYRALTGYAEGTVSTYVFNNGGRIDDIRGGADMRVRTLARAYQWLSDHWPHAHPWPPDIPRPPRTPTDAAGTRPDRPRRRGCVAPLASVDAAAAGGARATK